MKVAKLYNYNDIRIEDMPVPSPGPGEALLKTKACGICSGDVMPWYIEKKAPLVLGHEPSGVIVAKGDKVNSFKIGDRVFVHHHAPCFNCKYCKKGDYVQCDTWKNSKIIPGGISEYILIPETNLENDTLNLPETVNFEDGTLIEPTACVVKSLKRAGIRRGDTILVIGLGVMGMLHILLARKYGAEKIIGTDMVPYRLKKAEELGADITIDVSNSNLSEELNSITDGLMADIVIICPNSVSAMQQGILCAGPGGRVVFFTPAKPYETLIINPNEIYFRDINIITSYSCGPSDTADALELITDGVVNARKLITHRFKIEDTMEAFRLTAEAKNSLKSIITFD
ncbi:MAG: alcohol dehydrogenase catalytic domain-containing protein [Nitrospirae bacterium]|jgi:L-iditol 2-dehydrogenase|nr:alcohol dehydrogenase catalytic domain-containing protein [Nitrospirota bacterium]